MESHSTMQPKLSLRSEMSTRSSTRVSDIRKQSLFSIMDKDGAGTINKEEFDKLYDVIEQEAAKNIADQLAANQRAERNLRKCKLFACLALVMCAFLFISMVSNFTMMFLVVDSQVKTTTDSSGVLQVKGGDGIVKTAVATEKVPLVAAPILDFDTLAKVQSLMVSYPTENSTTEVKYTVSGVRRTNSTFVEFITTVPGHTVEALNGVASIVVRGSKRTRKIPVCSGDAECSAFKAAGVDTEAAMAVAASELEKHGFIPTEGNISTSEPEGRRLQLARLHSSRVYFYFSRCNSSGVWTTIDLADMEFDSYSTPGTNVGTSLGHQMYTDTSAWRGYQHATFADLHKYEVKISDGSYPAMGAFGGAGYAAYHPADLYIRYFTQFCVGSRNVVYLLHGLGNEGLSVKDAICSGTSCSTDSDHWKHIMFVIPTSGQVDESNWMPCGSSSCGPHQDGWFLMFPTIWNHDIDEDAMGYTLEETYYQFSNFWTQITTMRFEGLSGFGYEKKPMVGENSKAMIFGISDGGRLGWVANMLPTIFDSFSLDHVKISKAVGLAGHPIGSVGDTSTPGTLLSHSLLDFTEVSVAVYWTYNSNDNCYSDAFFESTDATEILNTMGTALGGWDAVSATKNQADSDTPIMGLKDYGPIYYQVAGCETDTATNANAIPYYHGGATTPWSDDGTVNVNPGMCESRLTFGMFTGFLSSGPAVGPAANEAYGDCLLSSGNPSAHAGMAYNPDVWAWTTNYHLKEWIFDLHMRYTSSSFKMAGYGGSCFCPYGAHASAAGAYGPPYNYPWFMQPSRIKPADEACASECHSEFCKPTTRHPKMWGMPSYHFFRGRRLKAKTNPEDVKKVTLDPPVKAQVKEECKVLKKAGDVPRPPVHGLSPTVGSGYFAERRPYGPPKMDTKMPDSEYGPGCFASLNGEEAIASTNKKSAIDKYCRYGSACSRESGGYSSQSWEYVMQAIYNANPVQLIAGDSLTLAGSALASYLNASKSMVNYDSPQYNAPEFDQMEYIELQNSTDAFLTFASSKDSLSLSLRA